MEHRHAVLGLGVLDAEDDLALLVLARVARRSKHHAHGPLVVPRQVDVVGTAFGHGHHHVHQVVLQTRQHHLRFRIAEAGVVLKHLRAFGRQHEAAVQHAAVVVLKRRAGRCGRGRLHDLLHDLKLFRRHNRHRRVHAHAAGIRTLVAIESALVILRRGHAMRLAAGNERQKRALGTGQALLHQHLRACVAERAVKAAANGFFGLFDGLRNHNALASGQAVGLHHNGGAQLAHIGQRRLKLGEAAVARRGDAVGLHEFLAVGFAALKLRTLRVGAEHGHASRAQHVGHAGNQRGFRADDHQVDGVLLHKGQHRFAVFGIQVRNVLRDVGRAAVAGSNEKLVSARRFRQRPRDGMLATAAAQNQDVHE